MLKESIILEEAKKFRRSIENCFKELKSPGFNEFPIGSCGDATPLLGTYLRELDLGNFNYVFGQYEKNNNKFTHAWAQSDSLIVDITADQFDVVSDSVIVSNNSIWHKRFKTQINHIADYRIYDQRIRDILEYDYEIIKKNIITKLN